MPDDHARLDIVLPFDCRPSDGRFGSGPSKIRIEAVRALAEAAPTFLGTSHRREGVRSVVRAVRQGLAELFSLPEGWEVLLGNGGTTAFWDAATFGLIRQRSQHLVFGEFSAKFADAARRAPWLDEPQLMEAAFGTHPVAAASAEVDLYALTHNETSTGVAMELRRPEGATGLVAVDATSAAGGLRWDPGQVDVYYFAPQKCFGSEGGLWLAACSPTALGRIESLAASDRYVPAFLDLGIALENSRLDQTYNTPALATLFLLRDQIDWMRGQGGLEWAASRCDRSAEIIYGWAEGHPVARTFVSEPAQRSHVVATIDLDDSVEAATVSAVLRRNGMLDIDSYRKLGRNQLRIAMFPAIEPDDVATLTRAIDHVIAAMTS